MLSDMSTTYRDLCVLTATSHLQNWVVEKWTVFLTPASVRSMHASKHDEAKEALNDFRQERLTLG